jgi:hypothetical protein
MGGGGGGGGEDSVNKRPDVGCSHERDRSCGWCTGRRGKDRVTTTFLFTFTRKTVCETQALSTEKKQTASHVKKARRQHEGRSKN